MKGTFMPLLDLIQPSDDAMLEENFYVLLDTHVPYFKTHPDTMTVQVTGQQADKYRGDLGGLLDSVSVDKKYHHLVARMNGYNSCTDYDGSKLSFLIPNYTVALSVMNVYSAIED